MTGSLNVKGTALRGALRFAKSNASIGGVEGILAALPPSRREAFGERIIANAWYPYPLYSELLAALRARLGSGRLPEVGRFLAEQDVGAAFQVITAAASVESVMRRSGVFWSRHCDQGRFVTRHAEPGHALGAIEDCPGISADHCILVAGWIEGIALASGATTAEVSQVRCVHRGDELCEYDVRWT